MRPEYLSVSQVTCFLTCPRKYRFRYVDKLPAERRSAHLAFGAAIHSGIEWWQEQRIARRSVNAHQALRIFRSDWTAQCAAGDLSFDEDMPAADYQALGEKLVTLFVERFADEVPTSVEQRFEVPLRDPATGDVLATPLVGYLDFTLDGVVGEMKTTSRKSAASAWLLQLSAYSYAQREVTGVRSRMRVVQLVKTKQPKIEVEEVTLSERDEAWFVEIAYEVLVALDADVFFPIPSWQCPTCEYRRACRKEARLHPSAA